MDKAGATDWLRKQAKKIDEHDTLAVTEETASAVTVEAWLQRRGVKYAPPIAIPMHLIDERRSRNNQARRDPLVAESVERFAASMRTGRPFPPIVVYPLGSKLVIIDGNNRHEAAKRAKLETIFGIIIDATTDSDTIQRLTVEANVGHGVTPAVEWRIRQAFHLCSLGFSDKDASEAAGISLAQLGNARAAAEAEARAKILRISGFAELPMTVKQVINGLKNEPVFHAAAALAANNKMTIELVRDMCRKVKSGKSEAEQLAIVAEFQKLHLAEAAATKALNKRISSPKTALATGIGLLNKVDTSALVNQIITTHDRDLVVQRLKECETKLLELMIAVEGLEGMEE